LPAKNTYAVTLTREFLTKNIPGTQDSSTTEQFFKFLFFFRRQKISISCLQPQKYEFNGLIVLYTIIFSKKHMGNPAALHALAGFFFNESWAI
jgi:hypothetical protein